MTEIITLSPWALLGWLLLSGLVGAGIAVIAVSVDTKRRLDVKVHPKDGKWLVPGGNYYIPPLSDIEDVWKSTPKGFALPSALPPYETGLLERRYEDERDATPIEEPFPVFTDWMIEEQRKDEIDMARSKTPPGDRPSSRVT